MNKQIKISSLRRRIEENDLGMTVVFGVDGKVDICSDFNNGEEPYKHYLELEGNAELLYINAASPIWKNLLVGDEDKRPIYKITDPESGGWMEIVIYEK